MIQTREEIDTLQQEIRSANEVVDRIRRNVSQVIIGQQDMIERLFMGLFCGGHILLEGLPGLAKTLAIKSLARSIHADFHRIQFTPDLLPGDIIGTLIYDPKSHEFQVRKGPVFAHFVLADEINRAPAKVQSALLEAMQELQVTIGAETLKLPDLFLVLATQNPIEQEGTFPLPEAQSDRFMMKVRLDYPSREEELQILRLHLGKAPLDKVQAVASLDDIRRIKHLVNQVFLDEKIEQYILDIVFATRQPAAFKAADLAPYIRFGASPRATLFMAQAARAQAFLNQRYYVTPDDVRTIAPDILRHRIGLSFEAEAEGLEVGRILEGILSRIQVP